MTPNHPTFWFLKLIIPGRFGWLATFFLIFLVLFGFYWMSGALTMPDSPQGVILFFIAILAYLPSAYAWIASRADQCRQQLMELLPSGETPEWVDFHRRSVRWQLLYLAGGLTMGSIHMMMLFWTDNLEFSSSLATRITVLVMLGSMLVWVVSTTVIGALFECAYAFRDIADRIEINLFKLEQLAPFAHIASVFMLALVGAQAAFSLMLIQGFTFVAFVPGWLGLFVPMFLLMALPIVPVRRSIIAAKAIELARVDKLITAERDGHNDPATLAPLLVYKREVAEVRELPFDVGSYARAAFYLLLPPLTWVGAALIENVVDSFVG